MSPAAQQQPGPWLSDAHAKLRARIEELGADQHSIVILVDRLGRLPRKALKVMGWSGRDSVFRMSQFRACHYMDGADPVTGRWLESEIQPGEIRLLLFHKEQFLLLNVRDGVISQEPGSFGEDAKPPKKTKTRKAGAR